MIRRTLLELVPRSAWPRQCGAEVSVKNIMGTDGSSIQLENARGHCSDQVQSTTFNSADQLFPRDLSMLYPLPEQAGSFNTHRPTAPAAV
jgi:hypothetical protein